MKPLPLNNVALGKSCQSRIELLQKQIAEQGKIDSFLLARAFQKLRLNWNYHSNAIEGNQLTYGETVALLMQIH